MSNVREKKEYDFVNIEGKLVPLGEVLARSGEIPKDKKVVVQCRSGGRSGQAVRQLEEAFGYENLYNLKGGILAWADEIDPTKPKY